MLENNTLNFNFKESYGRNQFDIKCNTSEEESFIVIGECRVIRKRLDNSPTLQDNYGFKLRFDKNTTYEFSSYLIHLNYTEEIEKQIQFYIYHIKITHQSPNKYCVLKNTRTVRQYTTSNLNPLIHNYVSIFKNCFKLVCDNCAIPETFESSTAGYYVIILGLFLILFLIGLEIYFKKKSYDTKTQEDDEFYSLSQEDVKPNRLGDNILNFHFTVLKVGNEFDIKCKTFEEESFIVIGECRVIRKPGEKSMIGSEVFTTLQDANLCLIDVRFDRISVAKPDEIQAAAWPCTHMFLGGHLIG
ncbi:hypothetical protein RF11_13018 [Thelohanellus kitauei]|uniref:Uncharacterized protein n=1 Tax=Thelohanellus kitauei TaxID=669202 RepID=A0A0C2MIW6_THEKT|nr:hypothetical protein RF11_13018 [Thelohanellus kitauei]